MQLLFRHQIFIENTFKFLNNDPEKLKNNVEKINGQIVEFLKQKGGIDKKDRDKNYYIDLATRLEAVKSIYDENKSVYDKIPKFSPAYTKLNKLISGAKDKAKDTKTPGKESKDPDATEAPKEGDLAFVHAEELLEFFENPKAVSLAIVEKMEDALKGRKQTVDDYNFDTTPVHKIYDDFQKQIEDYFSDKGGITKEKFNRPELNNFVKNYEDKLDGAVADIQRVKEEVLMKKYNYVDLGFGYIAPKNSIGAMLNAKELLFTTVPKINPDTGEAEKKRYAYQSLEGQYSFDLGNDFTFILKGGIATDRGEIRRTMANLEAIFEKQIKGIDIPKGMNYEDQVRMWVYARAGGAMNGAYQSDLSGGGGVRVQKNIGSGIGTAGIETGYQTSNQGSDTDVSDQIDALTQLQQELADNGSNVNGQTYEQILSELQQNKGIYLLFRAGYVQDFIPGKTTRINFQSSFLSQKTIREKNQIKALVYDDPANIPADANENDITQITSTVTDVDGNEFEVHRYIYHPVRPIAETEIKPFSIGSAQIEIEQELPFHTDLKIGAAYANGGFAGTVSAEYSRGKQITKRSKRDYNEAINVGKSEDL